MFKISKVLILIITLIVFISILVTGCSKISSYTALTTTPSTSSTSSTLSIVQSSTTSTMPLSPTAVSTLPTFSIPSTTPTTQEITANSLMATVKFQSLKFDMDFSMSLDLPTGGQTTTMTIQETAMTSINIPNKEMDMTTSMVLEIPNQNKQNVSGEIYSENGWIYIKQTIAGVDQWSKMKMTDEMWAMQSKISSMTDFLKSPVNLELAGSENIKGVDCYVLSITPDIQVLTNWMEGQIQSGQTGINLNNVDISKMLQNFTVKEWIAKDSYLLTKQQIGIKLNTNSGNSTTSPDTTPMNMDMNATLTFYDYGQPVTIQLPPEALNAQEITLPQ